MEIAAFLARHGNHRGVQVALQWLASWVWVDETNRQRLVRHGVQPLDVLTEVLSLFLLSNRRPHKLVDDMRLTFAIGNRVLHLAPLSRIYGGERGGKHRLFSRPIGKVARRSVGTKLRVFLTPLFVGVALALDAEHEAAKQTHRDLSTPFTTNHE